MCKRSCYLENKLKKIICIGGACIDRTLTLLQQLKEETSNPVLSFTSFGGVARNVAENLGRWTKEVQLRCLVGDDREGKALLAHMQKLGVHIDNSIISTNHTTSHYYAVLNHENDLHIAFSDMTIYDNISFSQFTLCNWPKDSLIFIDTNLPQDIVQYFIQQSQQQDFRLCIDPVSIAKAQKLPPKLENIFLLKPNRDEASVLTNIKITSLTTCLQAGILLLEKGVKNVVISLGPDGYVVVNKNYQACFPCVKPKAINNVNGAGDAFIAGILYGLQQDYDILQACELGALAAALTVESKQTVAENITVEKLQAVYV